MRIAVLLMLFTVMVVGTMPTLAADYPPSAVSVKAKTEAQPATSGDSAAVLPDLLPAYAGDKYGEVSGQDPWDCQYDKATGEYRFMVYVNAPEGVAWTNNDVGQAPYKVMLGGLNRPSQPDPAGVWIEEKAVEFRFKPCGASRLFLPLTSADAKTGWGWIYPSIATVAGSENGYGKFNFPDTGIPTIVAVK